MKVLSTDMLKHCISTTQKIKEYPYELNRDLIFHTHLKLKKNIFFNTSLVFSNNHTHRLIINREGFKDYKFLQ